MADLSSVTATGLAASAAAAQRLREGFDRAGRVLVATAGTVAASLGELNHGGVDSRLCGRMGAAAIRTPEFWRCTLGNAVEAGVCTAAISAADQLLVHRDELINGSPRARRERLAQILQTSGLMAAGALPVSAFLAVALTLVPGLTAVMGPLGMIGSAGVGVRLIASAVGNPSRQEREAIQRLEGLLRETLYALQRDSDGNLTITVRAQPAS